MIHDYDKLVKRISKVSKKDAEEINKLVEAKRDKLSGLISREGAAQIVASELGINFDKEKVKIKNIASGMKKVNTWGKVVRLFPVHEFEKNGRKGKVANLILADDTGNCKVVLWDANHISLIEKGEIKENDFVEIANSRAKERELHLSGFSDIKKTDKKIENIKTGKDFEKKSISDFSIGGYFKTRAFIVQAFNPKFFNVCPECGKKVLDDSEGYRCKKHGKVSPEKRALMSIVIDDGTDNIRAVLFSEQINGLGLKDEELEPERFVDKKKDLLGKELFFSGNVRQNKMFNNLELIISKTKKVNVDNLIENLESSTVKNDV